MERPCPTRQGLFGVPCLLVFDAFRVEDVVGGRAGAPLEGNVASLVAGGGDVASLVAAATLLESDEAT